LKKVHEGEISNEDVIKLVKEAKNEAVVNLAKEIDLQRNKEAAVKKDQEIKDKKNKLKKELDDLKQAKTKI
jgi:hypothetical protein